jgi:hypothetical protein
MTNLQSLGFCTFFISNREEMEVAKLKATLEAVELKMRQEEQKKAQEEEQQKR